VALPDVAALDHREQEGELAPLEHVRQCLVLLSAF